VDRTGFPEFKKWAMEGVNLSDKTIVQETMYWDGIKY